VVEELQSDRDRDGIHWPVLAGYRECAGRPFREADPGKPAAHLRFSAKGLNGYKTDPQDAEWIAGLLDSGRRRGSWVPPREIRERRDLTRQRVPTLEDANRVKNRIEQLCQTGNIKISSVAMDLFGVSGRKMLKALVEGQRDAGWMADYARTSLRSKKRELELAWDGSFTANQRWRLDRELRQLGMAGDPGRGVRAGDGAAGSLVGRADAALDNDSRD